MDSPVFFPWEVRRWIIQIIPVVVVKLNTFQAVSFVERLLNTLPKVLFRSAASVTKNN